MDLNPLKRKILETLWREAKPLKPKEIAQKTGLEFPSCMMHLIGLKRLKHVYTPQKGYYTITNHGKQALGFPKINAKKALEILSPVPTEKAFYFYTGIGKYLGLYATSLQDFCDKIQTINIESLNFHVPRRDFELWLEGLGDIELAKKVSLIREEGVNGEELRKRLYETVKTRCEELKNLG
ncbi:MAG: DUF5752 family protein [Candidatus Bathyarchaeia archaeon]